jgi:hypothetical protein
MHTKYSKTGETGIFSPVIFLVTLDGALCIPLIFLFLKIFPLSDGWDYLPFVATAIILLILNCKRYYKKGKAVEIIKTYKHSKYNKIFPDWTMTALAFVCILGGFACIKPVSMIYKYITSLFA